MAANMQHMAGVGQMGIPQQMRKPTTTHQLQQYVYQQILARSQGHGGLAWHANVSLSDRMGKTMELYASPNPKAAQGRYAFDYFAFVANCVTCSISNITLAVNNNDTQQAVSMACKYEEETFKSSPSKVRLLHKCFPSSAIVFPLLPRSIPPRM